MPQRDSFNILAPTTGQASSNVGIFTPNDQSYSAWNELITSSSRETIAILVTLKAAIRNALGDTLFQFATGASGSEVPIMGGHEFVVGLKSSGGNIYAAYIATIPVPIRITSGSRVSVRAKGNSGTLGDGSSGTTAAEAKITLLEI